MSGLLHRNWTLINNNTCDQVILSGKFSVLEMDRASRLASTLTHYGELNLYSSQCVLTAPPF